MKNKIIGIVVCILFIGSSLLPNINGITNDKKNNLELSTSSTDWWPMFRHDLSHTGYSNSKGPETNAVLWTHAMNEYSGALSIGVVDNKVYVSSNDGWMHCLNATTGFKIWGFNTGFYRIPSTPAVIDGKMFFLSNKMYCLNSENGVLLWEYPISSHAAMASSPAVIDGKVYVGCDDFKVYCFDATTGYKIWDFTTGSCVESSPAIFNGKIYIGSLDEKLYCLNAITGAKIWEYTTGGYIVSSPAIVNGKVYFSSHDNKTYCLNAENGMKIWEYLTHYCFSSPAIAEGKVYIGSTDRNLYCLDAVTGGLVWNYQTGSTIGSSPTIADGKVYFCSYDEKLYCFNALTGEKIWDYVIGMYAYCSPVIADDRLFIHSYNKNVYCFGDNSGNKPPNPPTVTGEINGIIKTSYNYTIQTTDPDQNDVEYFIDWGDDSYSGWIGPYDSGEITSASHSWGSEGDYVIKVKARDTHSAESGWATLSVTMPYSYTPLQQFFEWLFHRFPNAFPLLRHLMED